MMEPQAAAAIGGGLIIVANIILFWVREWVKHKTWSKNVSNRSHILFHKGNLSDDTHGCVLVGEQFEPLKGENAVLASGKAFTEFKKRTRETNIFLLQIESHK